METPNRIKNETGKQKNLRILMSGGGTGGHIYPAIAIADEIKRRYPKAEFLFIGALGKMEMEKVPQAGYSIKGLNIHGWNRNNLLANAKLPFKIMSSIFKAKEIVKKFDPHFVIGTGGFASGPALYAAASFGIPTFIQEQNAHAGITNKILSKSARKIFTAYPEVTGFPPEKIYFSGNPIRENITIKMDSDEAKRKLGLDPEKITILSVGGSLGSRTINNTWVEHLPELKEKKHQLIWQTGKSDYPALSTNINIAENPLLHLYEFIADMALAYSAADIIVSRAGAIAISEITVTGKPVILVPFPYAAEDHQTKNAMNLVDKNAARMVKDSEMKEHFWNLLQELGENDQLRKTLGHNMALFAKPNATQEIVNVIFKTLKIE